MKDIFSTSRKLSFVASHLRRVFELWGYQEVFLPALTRYRENIRKGIKIVHSNDIYAVNPDPTSQILESVRDTKRLKLYYIKEVLNGSPRGIWQAGIEFIGGKEMCMGTEIILVAIASLEAIGIRDFRIDIGSKEIWNRTIGKYSSYKKEIFRALILRNFEIIESLPIDDKKKKEMWNLFNFRGRKFRDPKLNGIVEMVKDDRVFIDLGTVRPLPYYTDIIFEIYSPYIGTPIGGGGEYEFNGKSAFGFAFNLNVLISLLDDVVEKGVRNISGVNVV